MAEPGVVVATGAAGLGGDPLPLAGMTVVVTGAMSGPLEALSRGEMNALIERAGGKASSSVSARTKLLVAGERAGSKREKAELLGVRVIDPQEFAGLLGGLID